MSFKKPPDFVRYGNPCEIVPEYVEICSQNKPPFLSQVWISDRKFQIFLLFIW